MSNAKKVAYLVSSCEEESTSSLSDLKRSKKFQNKVDKQNADLEKNSHNKVTLTRLIESGRHMLQNIQNKIRPKHLLKNSHGFVNNTKLILAISRVLVGFRGIYVPTV